MITLSLALLASAQGPAPAIADATPIDPQTYEVQVVAEGLEQPWDLAWTPEGDILVAERSGRLRIIRDGEMLAEPVSGLPDDFHVANQAGLFEVEPHPGFAENGLLYLSYAAERDGGNTLVLTRGRFEATEAGGALSDVEILFEAAPLRGSSAHYGGRIVWLDDGTLLLSNGEGYRYREEAQRLDNHFGKVLRLTEDGDAPGDNPFVDRDGALPEIWSYGHRNPQGLTLGPDGTIYEHEHGPRGGDEVNILTAGANYGWPVITYGIDYSGAQISPFTEMRGMEQPLFHWTPSIAPSGLVYYDGTAFPGLQGRLLSGALAFKHLRVADPSDPDGAQQTMLGEREMRIRDVALSPEGRLYVTTETKTGSGGEVLAILPKR